MLRKILKFEGVMQMKMRLCLILILLFFSLSAYAAKHEQTESTGTLQVKEQITQSGNEDMPGPGKNDQKIDQSAVEESDTAAKVADDNHMKLQIGEYIFIATLADNSSAKALRKMIEEGPITINMRDYGNMEKVGSLGTNLPRNDEQITTEPGDLILYQGNSFVIYYAPNSWKFTRIGKINNVAQEELKEALGSGDVIVTLSVNTGP